MILFWPFVALTGHYLLHRHAVAIFCSMGFLVSVGLLQAMRRRYFDKVNGGIVAAGALALGLATGMPVLLSRSDVYEVPISCGYMMCMLTLAAVWCALHETERRWLAVASTAYGLAVASRPSLLFGAVILFLPVIQAWRERRSIWVLLLAAITPILIIGLGLMLYNYQRFGSPSEFGMRYLLSGDSHPASARHFNIGYLAFNLRVYFLKSVGWSHHFPYIRGMTPPPLPPGHGSVEGAFGVLVNTPLTWLALAVPLAWRSGAMETVSPLRWFIIAVSLLFGISVLTLGLFHFAAVRYEVEFLPELMLLAVIGILGAEQAWADQPARRCALRWVWGLLLGFSVTFNLLASVEYHAEAHQVLGVQLSLAGKPSEAIGQFEQALRLYPDYPKAHLNLGIALEQLGRTQDAIDQYKQALLLNPDYAKARMALERLQSRR